MNIEQLMYIVDVYKTQSISNTANNLHVTQAGISKSIIKLENELGIKIFKRTKAGTLPTLEGKRIIEKATEVMMKIEEVKKEADIHSTMVNGSLSIAGTQGLFITILPKTLSIFKNEYPGVRVEISEKGTQSIIKDVKENKIDLGLTLLRKEVWKQTDLDIEVLFERKMHVIVNRNSHLAKRKTLSPKDVINETVVVYNGQNSKAFIEDFIAKYGEMNILFLTSNSSVIKNTVAEGLAINFSYDISNNWEPNVLSNNIIPIPLVNHEPSTY